MYAFIAPVTDQTATTKPKMVKKRLEPGCALARLSELSSRSAACFGITLPRWSMRLVMADGDAMSVKRPVATIRTAGIAKKVAYAIAEARSGALAFLNFFT